MDTGDKSWMNLPRITEEYIHGVNDFLNKAFERASQGNEILCPCKKCFNHSWHYRNVVEDHLFEYGFVRGYAKWVFHGEGFSSRNKLQPTNANETSDMHDDIDKLLHDTFKNVEDELRCEGVREGPSEDAKRFFRLVDEGKQELYPGCKSFTKLSFTIRLFLLKCIHGLSNAAFSDLLDLLKNAFLFAQIPESFHKAKKVIKDLGLDYEKIHACPNDCMLFCNDNANIDNCVVCGSSRWKSICDDLTNKTTKVPMKVLRYFPLKPRLQTIFMCSETSLAMRWHTVERPNDGNLRHPVDGQAWKDFDSLHPDFSKDVCNVNEVDEFGLTRVYFNKKCSTDDPFVLASQVHHVFYVEDPIEKQVYYARNKVPVDLDEENCLNIEKTFWREPNDDIGPLERSLDIDVRWSREDLPVDIVDVPFHAQRSQHETSEEEDDFDNTDWDWMEADD